MVRLETMFAISSLFKDHHFANIYENTLMHVEVIRSQSWRIFETQCIRSWMYRAVV